MNEPQNEVEHAALDWLVRVNDPDFADWADWEAWLAREPGHAEVYWRVAEAEVRIVEALRASPRTTTARRPARPAASRRMASRHQPLAIAASLAAAVLLGVWGWSMIGGRAIETPAGVPRTVTLEDGTRLHLDGATRVALRGGRKARLERGRLLAEVRHDDARPFVLEVGDAVLTDLGTTFDVTRLGDGVRVAVTEGLVRVDLPDQAHLLEPGQGLIATGGRVEPRGLAVADVEAWRQGRLVYHQEPIAVVAQDLARAIGGPVSVDPRLAGRRFTGSLRLGLGRDALRPRVELLLDVTIVDEGGVWRLTPRTP